MTAHITPAANAPFFHCPFCGVSSQQNWAQFITAHDSRDGRIPGYQYARCATCGRYSLWVGDEIVYPDGGLAPPPQDDMPEDVRSDYDEARVVLGRSSKAAAALLRLAIQRLMPYVGESGRNLDSDIKSLVNKGLPVEIQQALDTVRVIGNESVHPGTMDINDSPEVAVALFELVNMIVYNRISQPGKIKAMYEGLPAEKLEGIRRRDQGKAP